jgi:hypothetical protein
MSVRPVQWLFDTAPGGFGSQGYRDVSNFNGTDVTTGLTGYTPSGSALDGGTLSTFTFDNFAVGESFSSMRMWTTRIPR